MFVPKLFRMNDLPVIEDFIRKNSFATLVTYHEEKPWATHLPLELELNQEGEKALWGHVSRANPQWKSFAGNGEALAIFQGPHTYVSSSWYNHLNVPTWNYIAIHIYGRIRIMSEEESYEILRRLVKKYEVTSANPVSVETMPQDFVKKEMKGIVAFEMSIEKLEGKWKLSQNRDEEDYRTIITELEKLNDTNAAEVASEMRKLRP